MIIIKTTVNNPSIKKKIINKLLINKYAACINVIEKANSNYIWDDKIICAIEDILLIKTTKNKEKIVYKTIKELHNYDIPEISTINISKVEKKYFKWLTNITR